MPSHHRGKTMSDQMHATVSWKGDLGFDCVMDTGETLHLDGNKQALSPMQTVLMAVGACSSVDVVEIMKKTRQDFTDCHCELIAERASDAPRVFTKIHAHYIVTGKDIHEKHLARAVQLSTEKYCSVMLMLDKTVEITTSYEAR